MSFWAHSMKARWAKERKEQREEQHARDVVIAKAALAGWRFKYVEIPTCSVWETYDPHGMYHGTNETLYGAAKYALGVI